MKIKSFLVALLFVPPFAVSAAAEGRMNENTALAQACGNEGCEVPAPTWSAACMTDQGPSQCDEPMWIYGGRGIAAGQMSTIPQKHDNSDGRKYNVTRRQPHL
jgi:hypothetical protein